MNCLQSIVASFLPESITVPVTVQAAMLIKMTSSVCILLTFLYFSSYVFTPRRFVSKWNFILNQLMTGGIYPGKPRMLPVSLSAQVNVGSS